MRENHDSASFRSGREYCAGLSIPEIAATVTIARSNIYRRIERLRAGLKTSEARARPKRGFSRESRLLPLVAYPVGRDKFERSVISRRSVGEFLERNPGLLMFSTLRPRSSQNRLKHCARAR